MKKWKTESELQIIARKISWKVWMRGTDGVDTILELPQDEQEKVYNIVYGALLALDYGSGMMNVDNAQSRQAILDTAEYVFDVFFPFANGYLSVYRPLEHVIDEWEEKEEEE